MVKNKLIAVLIIMLMIASASATIAGNVEGNKNSNENQDFINPTLKISYPDPQENKNIQNSFQVDVEIVEPENGLYLFDNKILPFIKPIIIGPITIKCEVTPSDLEPCQVEFLIDDELKRIVYDEPYEWTWDETAFFSHDIKVRATTDTFTFTGNSDQIDVSYFNIGTPSELTKDEAIDILVNEVIKPNTINHIVYAFTLDEPLNEGDQTSPWLPHPIPRSVETAPYPEYRTTTENEWFFYIDDSPRAKFSHPVRFVYINAKTAEIEVIEHRWWPLLNDEAIFCADEDYWNSNNWAYTNDNPPYEKDNPGGDLSNIIEYNKVRDTSSGCPCNLNNGQQECAIVINGNTGSETCAGDMATDAAGIGLFFGTYPGFNTQQLGPGTNNNNQSNIEDAFDNTEDCDDCVVYVTAHGGVAADGEPAVSCGGDLVWESEFCQMAGENPDCEYKWVFDCCHSGSFIESLSKQDNNRKVITASDKCQTAYGDIDDNDFVDPPPEHPDPNPDDEGSEFTSGFLEDLWDEWFKDPSIDIVELLDNAFESACDKDVCALNGITEPQVWEREEEDVIAPKNYITDPECGAYVDTPITVIGYATDFGGSGVALLDYTFEWAGGSHVGGTLIVDPPAAYASYTLGPIHLDQYIEPGDWMTITTYATDDAENTGEDSITITWQELEDTTPPITTKIIGEPNAEDGYIIWPYTPIWLEAMDPEPGSGVQYIYYEIAWDTDGDGTWDYVFEETIYQDSVEIQMMYYEIFYGKIELRWYAVDNANNMEFMKYQQHVIMER